MLGRLLVVVGVLSIGGCGFDVAGTESAPFVGLYMESDEPSFQVGIMAVDVVKAEDSDLVRGTRHHFGIAALVRSVANDTVTGYRVEFTRERPDSLVDELVSKARELGFRVVTVSEGSLWPDCVGEDDCDRAEFVR